MRTIPAREIKRRGIGAVDALLCEGPVHVIRNDRPSYVILTEQQYEDLVESMAEATLARVRASLDDVKAGRVQRHKSVEELIAAIEQSAQD
jgi:PHD/YefM family antitoxin component YafN of YafNO toxin-antitoxin module